MKVAIMPVSTALLVQALHLPDDTEITAAFSKPEEPGVVYLVVRHDGLKNVAEGSRAPVVNPMFRTFRHVVNSVDSVEFRSWGQEP